MDAPDTTGQFQHFSKPGGRTDSSRVNRAEVDQEMEESGDDRGFTDGTENEVDPMIYARVVRAMAAAEMGADLSADETLNCLAESLNQEFLLTRTRVDVEGLAEKKSALDIAGMILRMLD